MNRSLVPRRSPAGFGDEHQSRYHRSRRDADVQGNLTTMRAGRYLDLTQAGGMELGPYLVPVHGLLRITLHGDTLTFKRKP
jgi:hypothetical protein